MRVLTITEFMTLFLCSAMVACVGPASSSTEGRDLQRATLQTLNGTYVSAGPEEWYGGYGHRTFTFKDGRWSLLFEFGFDPMLKQKVFTFRTEGPYRIGARSMSVPNAHEAVFFEDAKFVTFYPADPGLMAKFGMGDCGLEPGQEADISVRGCANWKPVAECREDHDLLAIDKKGQLYFGVRPLDNDMCTADKRPTALLAPVVRR